jgi:protein-tyrosine-phosphatase
MLSQQQTSSGAPVCMPRSAIRAVLSAGDASPGELGELLGMPSNLLAHHLKLLESRGLIVRTRSEGDRRRSYVRLAREALDDLTPGVERSARRVLFVCTANTARSHLAAALWRRASQVPATSAGTHPAERIDARAIATAQRNGLPLRRVSPCALDDVLVDGDLVITVCDLAREELGPRADLHWSIPDPVIEGSDAAFDRAFEHLAQRVETLAPSLVAR